MPYRLKISGLQYEAEIEGSEDWGRSVVRDFNDRIFRTRGDYRFIGHQGLYNLLYNGMSVNGACESFEARIYFNTGTSWDYEWRGDILPQDLEFDLIRRNVDAQILDASWSAKFNNSQDQKVFLRSTSSKNGLSIAQCDFNPCQFFDPGDPVLSNYLPDRRICFRVYDIFIFLVNYYSDATVTFESEFFEVGGDGDQYYITTGQEIRQAEGWVNPEVSFSEVFNEMNKKLNLWIVIEGTQDAPVLRVETWDYVFKNQKLLEIRDPENLTLKTDLDQLYTIIDVGSDALEFDIDNNANYPNPRFESWNNESYNTPGACEFENNTLDLVSSWKIDTNTIESVLAGDEDFDEDIFIIEIDPTAPDYDAFKFTTDLTGPDTVEYIYNYNLTNEQVMVNWFNGVPQEILKDLTTEYYLYVDTPNTFTTSSAQLYSDAIEYENDSVAPATDVDDIYTTSAESSGDDDVGEFKAPVDGYFDFRVSSGVDNPSINKYLTITAHIYTDNTRTRRRAIVNRAPIGREYVTGPTTIIGTFRLYMLFGEVVTFRIYDASAMTGNGGYDFLTGYAELNSVVPTYTEAPDDPLIYIYEASQYGMSRTDFDTIDQGRGFVRIIDTNGEKYYDVWAKDVKYNGSKCVIESGEFIGGRPPMEICWVLETGNWDDDCYWLDSRYWIDG